NIFIMSIPDNIPTLIQIIGRAIRLNSHLLLPMEKRHVDIHIFVSSMENLKTLSYEEEHYQNKIKTYKVIQSLEKIMHESAIDSYFNYDEIWNMQKKTISSDYELNILPYKLEKFNPGELNLSTFNTYYAKKAIEYYIYMIKRLFIETSSVWTYAHLYEAIRRPPFIVA